MTQSADDEPGADVPVIAVRLHLTQEQVHLLGEFADSMQAARRLLRLLAWVAGGIAAVAALLYYVFAAIAGWRSLHIGGTGTH